MDTKVIMMESIGWLSTALFLFSIVVPNRKNLHLLGLFAAVTTGIYGYYHGATAIWVKWLIAFFFHGYMYFKQKKEQTELAETNHTSS
ncbi:MAG: hypothetical protein H7328_06395 [Bdellovibrio sp.]|nr:hypothetical protein [Bdellovibrio sp.]